MLIRLMKILKVKNENFDKITNPLVLITQEQKNFEINALEK